MQKKKKSLGNYCRRQRNYTVWKNSRYELNVLTPENDVFFEKSEFYSDLKQKALRDSDYESSLFLYKTLKMRNLCDMNDLYNAQDVILLCEIAENRFQLCMINTALIQENVIQPVHKATVLKEKCHVLLLHFNL